MEEVGIHGGCSFEPALRNGVFAVIAIAFSAVRAASFLMERKGIGCFSTGIIGVHVPNGTVCLNVGLFKGRPHLGVRKDVGVAYDLEKRCF